MHFILIVFLLWLSVKFPGMLLGMALTLGLLYYCDKMPEFLKGLKIDKDKTQDEPKKRRSGVIDDYVDENGVMDWDSFHADKLESMVRPGYRDDPEWQKKSEMIRKQMEANKERSDAEDREEFNEEASKSGVNFWQKSR